VTAATLKYTIVVRHPETGVATALVEGSGVPEWAKDLVHKDDLEGGSPTKAPAKKSASSKSEK
jgi:hypothetical protein